MLIFSCFRLYASSTVKTTASDAFAKQLFTVYCVLLTRLLLRNVSILTKQKKVLKWKVCIQIFFVQGCIGYSKHTCWAWAVANHEWTDVCAMMARTDRQWSDLCYYVESDMPATPSLSKVWDASYNIAVLKREMVANCSML